MAETVNFFEAARDFIWAAQRAFQLGMQASTGGNISLRLGRGLFLTKPTGLGLADCRAEDLVVVDERGEPQSGTVRPTKEVQVHLSLFRQRPDVGAVAHFHSPYATAYACRGLRLPLPTVHARRIMVRVPLVPEFPEGSAELAAVVTEAASDPEVKGLLMAGHGMLALGGDLRQAQYRAELMEESAKVAWLAEKIA